MKKEIVIHNDAELYALLYNDTYIWHLEAFPKVKFSKEFIEQAQFKTVSNKKTVREKQSKEVR